MKNTSILFCLLMIKLTRARGTNFQLEKTVMEYDVDGRREVPKLDCGECHSYKDCGRIT